MLLSIESSCDDSSLALTEIASARLVFHHKISQDIAHSVYGGVVPEIASRLHAKELPEILAVLKEILGDFTKLKAVAVTTEPGMSVSLIEGLMMAKLLALSLRIPLISVNHLIGHFYSLFINQHHAVFPMGVLLVSGGHTQIIEAYNDEKFVVISESLDDSFGESFDKVAKMLSLGYPGGPIVESYAMKIPHNARIHPLPLPLKNKCGFSFSGLKNATRLFIESFMADNNSATGKSFVDSSLSEDDKVLVCASFQKAAIAHISDQVEKYLQHKKSNAVRDFAIVGGASSNASLRIEIERLCKSFGLRLYLAPLEFCSDNAAMIGRAAIPQWRKKIFAHVISQEVSPRSTSDYLQAISNPSH